MSFISTKTNVFNKQKCACWRSCLIQLYICSVKKFITSTRLTNGKTSAFRSKRTLPFVHVRSVSGTDVASVALCYQKQDMPFNRVYFSWSGYRRNALTIWRAVFICPIPSRIPERKMHSTAKCLRIMATSGEPLSPAMTERGWFVFSILPLANFSRRISITRAGDRPVCLKTSVITVRFT